VQGVHDEYFCWIEVLVGYLKGPLGHFYFCYPLVMTLSNCISLQNAKIYCHIKDDVDKIHLQKGIDSFVEWTDKWQMKLNIN